jgi:MtN3 and saliva related transmembrane protein
MQTTIIDAMGLTAAVLTTSAFLPQLVRTWRQGAHDLSYFMLALFFSGVALWLAYGLALGAAPIIVANAATALQVLILLFLKLRERGAGAR